jgi:hypothetical protein
VNRESYLLFFFFFNGNGFEVFCFEDLTAIETFQIIHPVASRDDLGTVVLTSGLHKSNMGFILMMAMAVSRGCFPELQMFASVNTRVPATQGKILSDAFSGSPHAPTPRH